MPDARLAALTPAGQRPEMSHLPAPHATRGKALKMQNSESAENFSKTHLYLVLVTPTAFKTLG